jgi:twitching motility two-component system response regulator PilH
MPLKPHWSEMANDLIGPVSSNGANHVVLIVEDYWDARPELKHVLKQKGYRVIDTDNGRDAAREARQTYPDLLLVDIDVPPIYGLVAARLIIKRAQVSPMPVVIVTHEDVVDRGPLLELGVSRNEYVTRLSDYEELQYLLDYLLPVLPQANDVVREIESSPRRVETIRLPLLAASAPKLHPRRGAGFEKTKSAAG